MPNEKDSSPVKVEPLSATEGMFDLDQSGHKAFSKDNATNLKSSENPYKTLGTLKLSFTMTGEEALNELRYGKKGTPESLAAINLLTAKAVERFGDGDNNFLTKYSGWNDWKGLLRNNGNDWEVAAHLLGADVKQIVNDKPWKVTAFDKLADSALTLRVASGLTEKYVSGTLRKDSDKEQYNKFSPELRRQLLKQYGTPAELPAWFDQTSATPSNPDQPVPKVTVQTPPEPISRSLSIDSLVEEDVDDNIPTALEKIAFEYLNKLTNEQRQYLIDKFTNDDLILAAQRLNQLAPGTLKYLAGLRDREGVVIFTPEEKAGLTIGLRTSMKMTELDDILSDENRLNKGFGIIEDFMDDTGLSFDVLMALNMMIYTTESKEFIKADFNFKRQLFEKYKASLAVPVSATVINQVDSNIGVRPRVEAKTRLGNDANKITKIPITEAVKTQLQQGDELNNLESDMLRGDFRIFYQDQDGNVTRIRDFNRELERYFGNGDDLVRVNLRATLNEIRQRDLINDDTPIETQHDLVRQVLLTRVEGDTNYESVYSKLEDDLRTRMWDLYKSENLIQT